MFYIFRGASSFNQNIGEWNFSNVCSMDDMFLGITLSTDNYEKNVSM
ncbi:MAG: BspA family leucine-rich repeat surface protein [Candidatus Lokiarchaeota archaeon]|nr:BspA family leucine-rich repeat surface protein [Candidatus Lokiarchaeota archaeon]